MYFIRTGSISDLIVWIALAGSWWVGGWLLVRYAFQIRRSERLITGLAVGFLLFIVLSNLWANIVPFIFAIWGSSATVLVLGIIAWWQRRAEELDLKLELRGMGQLAALLCFTVIFALMNRGLAILDDYHNLPIVSMLAAGDVPPHFYLNPDYGLAYHYGLHLFAGSLVRIGGLFPWGAFDLSKAFSQALLVILAWIWFKRMTRSELASYLGSGLVMLGGGARWILLFLPASWLLKLNKGIRLLGSARHSGPDLYTVLQNPWEVEGGGLFPYPFAFMNGIFPPQVLAIAGSGAVPALTIILMLLLRKRGWQPLNGLIFGLILASLAITGEHLFVMVVVGLIGALFFDVINRRSAGNIWQWGWILVPALALAVWAGGVLTEIGTSMVSGMVGGTVKSFGYTGFGFRWPPAVISAHLGRLLVTNPGQLMVALNEIGIIIILAPGVTWWAWRRFERGGRFIPALGLTALIGFVLPLVLIYVEHERDITRLTAAALFIWLTLGWPLVWFSFIRAGRVLRVAIACFYLIAILSGIVGFAISLISIPNPQFTYYVDVPDAMIAKQFWNELEDGSQVLDPIPFRAVTLFGRGGGIANSNIYTPLPEWGALFNDPDPIKMARAGYAYLYFDKAWWRDLQPKQKAQFEHPCVVQLAELNMPDRDFRKLLYLQDCR